MKLAIVGKGGAGNDTLVYVAAGSLVRENKSFPPGVLIAGNPATVKRKLSEEEIKKNLRYAANYVEYSKTYLEKSNLKIIK